MTWAEIIRRRLAPLRRAFCPHLNHFSYHEWSMAARDWVEVYWECLSCGAFSGKKPEE